MAHATAKIGNTPYAVTVRAGNHDLVADEPPKLGGQDAGPAPYDLLLASLGACTAITLKMYADRKQWAFKTVRVELMHRKENGRSRIERTLFIEGDLSPEQRQRMAEIAEKTPVTLTLKAGADIHTSLL
jgi:putative redox protein